MKINFTLSQPGEAGTIQDRDKSAGKVAETQSVFLRDCVCLYPNFNVPLLIVIAFRELFLVGRKFSFFIFLCVIFAPLRRCSGQALRLCVIFFLWGGELILSGILVEEADELKGAFLKFPDLELVEETMKEERIGVLLKKSI